MCRRKVRGAFEWRLCSNRYTNDDESYNALTELLTRGRIAGLIPWEAIADETRPVMTWDVHANVQGFIRRELGWFLTQYRRDLQRTQPLHIEIVGEKLTIGGIINPVAQDYCIPTTLGRGYASTPPRHEMVQRFKRGGKDKMLILFLSDFDPDGDEIARSFARSIRDDFKVKNVEAVRVALTLSQVKERNLIPRIVRRPKTTSKPAQCLRRTSQPGTRLGTRCS